MLRCGFGFTPEKPAVCLGVGLSFTPGPEKPAACLGVGFSFTLEKATAGLCWKLLAAIHTPAEWENARTTRKRSVLAHNQPVNGTSPPQGLNAA